MKPTRKTRSLSSTAAAAVSAPAAGASSPESSDDEGVSLLPVELEEVSFVPKPAQGSATVTNSNARKPAAVAYVPDSPTVTAAVIPPISVASLHAQMEAATNLKIHEIMLGVEKLSPDEQLAKFAEVLKLRADLNSLKPLFRDQKDTPSLTQSRENLTVTPLKTRSATSWNTIIKDINAQLDSPRMAIGMSCGRILTDIADTAVTMGLSLDEMVSRLHAFVDSSIRTEVRMELEGLDWKSAVTKLRHKLEGELTLEEAYSKFTKVVQRQNESFVSFSKFFEAKVYDLSEDQLQRMDIATSMSRKLSNPFLLQEARTLINKEEFKALENWTRYFRIKSILLDFDQNHNVSRQSNVEQRTKHNPPVQSNTAKAAKPHSSASSSVTPKLPHAGSTDKTSKPGVKREFQVGPDATDGCNDPAHGYLSSGKMVSSHTNNFCRKKNPTIVSTMAIRSVEDIKKPRRYLDVSIAGTSLSALMDSGSEASIITLPLLEKLGLKDTIQPVAATILGYPNIKQVAVGMVTLSIQHKRGVTVVDFLVSEKADEPLLLCDGDLNVMGYQYMETESSIDLTPSTVVEPATDESDPLDSSITKIDSAGTVPVVDDDGVALFSVGTFYNSLNSARYDEYLSQIEEAIQINAEREFRCNGRPPIIINLKPGTLDASLPWSREYPLTDSDRKVAEEWIAKQLERGVIEPYNPPKDDPSKRPPHSCRVAGFVVAGKRVVLNLAPVNRHIDTSGLTDQLPPTLHRLVVQQADADIFTAIDLVSAYDQLRISDTSGLSIYLAINDRTMRLRSLPQGMISSPAIFNAVIQELLQGIPGCTCYFDDILIATRISKDENGLYILDEHVKSVMQVLDRLNSALGFKISGTKSTFFARTITSGGWKLQNHAVSITEEKLVELSNIQKPTTGKGLRSTLGLLNFFARSTAGMGIALRPAYKYQSYKGPLSKLSEGTHDEIWAGIQRAIELLMAAPPVATPDMNKPFVLATDACRAGYGAVLLQGDRVGNTMTNLVIVGFASRPTSIAESAWHAHRLELGAVVWGISKFEYYLRGRKFSVLTDHHTLVRSLAIEAPTAPVQRAWQFLESFHFDVVHIPGIQNVLPDRLSRIYETMVQPETFVAQPQLGKLTIHGSYPGDNNQAGMKVLAIRTSIRKGGVPTPVGVVTDTATSNTVSSTLKDKEPMLIPEAIAFITGSKDTDDNESITEEDAVSPSGAPIPPISGIKQPRWHPGLPYREPAVKHREYILRDAHSLGHQNHEAMVSRIQSMGWAWPGMLSEAKAIVEVCETCGRYNIARKGYSPAEPAANDSAIPGEQLAIDTVEYPATSRGHTCALIVVDMASRFVWAIALKTKSAFEIAQALLSIFWISGFPRIIASDNGTEFVNSVIAAMTQTLKIDHRFSSEYNPAGNAVAESSVRRISVPLRKLVESRKDDWDICLPGAAYIVNTTIAPKTGTTPFVLWYGRYPAPFTSYVDATPRAWNLEAEQHRMNQVRQFYSIVLPGLAMRQQVQASDRTVELNKRRTAVYKPGDIVMVLDETKENKLAGKYLGPFTVLHRSKGNNYRLLDSDNTVLQRRYPAHKLKIFRGTTKPTYPIEEILTRRIDPDGTPRYLVKWEGYPGEDSWEPEESFIDKKRLNDFITKANAAGSL